MTTTQPASGNDILLPGAGRQAPTIHELAEDATHAEHLIQAAKNLHATLCDPFSNRVRQGDLKALGAVLESAGSLVAGVAIELRTAADVADRQ